MKPAEQDIMLVNAKFNSAPLLSASQVREHLGGISGVTLWRWERDGIMPPAMRIGGRKYWPVSAVDELLYRAMQPGGIDYRNSPSGSASL